MSINELSKCPKDYYSFCSFKKHNCLAAFSCGRLDLGFQNNPDLIKNRGGFLEKLKINFNDLVCLRQVHGNRIFLATKKDRGKGALDYNSAVSGSDGMITVERRLPLAVFTADCLSIFILDMKNMVAGIVHAGWRGTRDNIAYLALKMLQDSFSSRAEDIICGLGPGIRDCCYEVGPEFKNYFSGGLIERKGKIFLDLAGANLKQMLELGVPEENITDSGICTSCQNKGFFSYRQEGQNTGRMMSLIMLN